VWARGANEQPCASQGISRGRGTFLLYCRTTITAILDSRLRDHGPVRRPRRQIEGRAPVQQEGLDGNDPGQWRPAHPCRVRRTLCHGVGPARPLERIRRRQQKRQVLPLGLLKDSTFGAKQIDTVAWTPLHTARRLDHPVLVPLGIHNTYCPVETRAVPRRWRLPRQFDRRPGALPKDRVRVSWPPSIVQLLTKRCPYTCVSRAVPAHDTLIPSLTSPDHACARRDGAHAEQAPLHNVSGLAADSTQTGPYLPPCSPRFSSIDKKSRPA